MFKTSAALAVRFKARVFYGFTNGGLNIPVWFPAERSTRFRTVQP
jgi:hypothetical protein